MGSLTLQRVKIKSEPNLGVLKQLKHFYEIESKATLEVPLKLACTQKLLYFSFRSFRARTSAEREKEK